MFFINLFILLAGNDSLLTPSYQSWHDFTNFKLEMGGPKLKSALRVWGAFFQILDKLVK